MASAHRNITPRRVGALRTEIAALVMLLMALAIVLVKNVPSAHQSEIPQPGETARVLPAAGAGAEILVAPQLQPAAGPEPDTL